MRMIVLFACLCFVAPNCSALAQDADWRSKRLNSAIDKFEQQIIRQQRSVVNDVSSLQLKANLNGDIKRVEALDEELDEFFKSNTLPKSVNAKRYKNAVSKALTSLDKKYESEIKKNENAGDDDVVKRLKLEQTSFANGDVQQRYKYFFPGDVFAGTRLTWRKEHRPFKVVLVDFIGNEFSGYLVRNGKNGKIQMPISGSVDGRKIEFRSKGIPGRELAMVDLTYSGEFRSGQIAFTFKGVGGTGENRTGTALVNRYTK